MEISTGVSILIILGSIVLLGLMGRSLLVSIREIKEREKLIDEKRAILLDQQRELYENFSTMDRKRQEGFIGDLSEEERLHFVDQMEKYSKDHIDKEEKEKLMEKIRKLGILDMKESQEFE